MKKTFEEAKLQMILVAADIITTSPSDTGAEEANQDNSGNQLP